MEISRRRSTTLPRASGTHCGELQSSQFYTTPTSNCCCCEFTLPESLMGFLKGSSQLWMFCTGL